MWHKITPISFFLVRSKVGDQLQNFFRQYAQNDVRLRWILRSYRFLCYLFRISTSTRPTENMIDNINLAISWRVRENWSSCIIQIVYQPYFTIQRPFNFMMTVRCCKFASVWWQNPFCVCNPLMILYFIEKKSILSF